jgi:RNA polymerase sigma-70 factor (ECF subfamily)
MRHQDWTSGPCDVDTDSDLQARIERELPLLLALARRLTRDEHDAQDAVQDALERAWRARHQLRDPAAAGGWLRSILARNVVDAHRRRVDLTTADPDELDMLIPDLDDPAAVVAAAEAELTLRAALRKLAPADRIALVLHDAEGWPATQLAELLDVRTDAAHKRIQRARTRLISALADSEAPTLTPPASACRDARAHAHELLDGTLDETTRAEIQKHLDTCPSCPAALQAAAGVLSALHAQHGAILMPEPLRARLDELVIEADEAR